MPKAQPPRLPLRVELVPSNMWGKNVRAVVSKTVWETLRWNLGATQNRPFIPEFYTGDDWSQRWDARCRYCGSKPAEMELHELWEYDDEKKAQRLMGFATACDQCHLAIHYGRAINIGESDKALAQLEKVNGWSPAKARQHVEAAMKTWESRSQIVYRQDYSYLHQWITPAQVHLDWLAHPKQWTGDYITAIQWARSMMGSKAVILDSETTGLLTYAHVEVIELAVIDLRGKVIYKGLFKPRRKIPKRTTAIHGITDKDVKDAPSFAESYADIQKALDGRIVIAFNAAFDRQVLERTCAKAKVSPPDCRWECAMLAFRAYMQSGRYLKLPGGAHRAVEDCRATLALLRQMSRGVSIPRPTPASRTPSTPPTAITHVKAMGRTGKAATTKRRQTP